MTYSASATLASAVELLAANPDVVVTHAGRRVVVNRPGGYVFVTVAVAVEAESLVARLHEGAGHPAPVALERATAADVVATVLDLLPA
ncbi:hypothetical protein [Aeromicrobium sp. Leaf291]|uniref:hypothetical protein n=1 Tax=Aeromicrobium sp. Leaf291 TaxID=1736325 RepID=UPI0006F2BEF9|nr:hypothetical protein [Aeromicrobium sp. Leaf291]KQP81597.1 hypothetical protein ASF35_16330 [Aeromicrobium sp. Leaf291]